MDKGLEQTLYKMRCHIILYKIKKYKWPIGHKQMLKIGNRKIYIKIKQINKNKTKQKCNPYTFF